MLVYSTFGILSSFGAYTMNKDKNNKRAILFKALSNPMRAEIIDLLLDGEKCVCEITTNLAYEQSHISKGLIKLKAAGLIEDRKDGLNVYYRLKCKCIKEF